MNEEPQKETDGSASAARGLLTEFQQFALKGNVVDLAVAVIVGNAFSHIVNSLVSGVFTPLAQLFGSPNTLQQYSVVLRAPGVDPATGSTTPAVMLSYGDVLQSIISFIISAGIIFLLIKLLTVARDRLFEKEQAGETVPPTPTPEVAVLQEIRDMLKEIKEK